MPEPESPHDAENLALFDLEARIGDPDDAVEFFQHLGLAQAAVMDRRKGGLALVTKNLPDIFGNDRLSVGISFHGISPFKGVRAAFPSARVWEAI